MLALVALNEMSRHSMRVALSVIALLAFVGAASASSDDCYMQTGPKHRDIFDDYQIVNNCAGAVHIEYDWGNTLGHGHVHLIASPCGGMQKYALSEQTSKQAAIWVDPDAKSKVCVKGKSVRPDAAKRDDKNTSSTKGTTATADAPTASASFAPKMKCSQDTQTCFNACLADGGADHILSCQTQCSKDAEGGGSCFVPENP
jgi:hypothetical protein